ncbi:hypothetical protein [Aquitalea sp. LB_tupeE]|uniref:hypothetical protein n=1 Tax=Aquitalea sp. LB_tupeE TaxID=2748078 RepID=UPI0015C15473|nr:hypothetical protein [Aquitalea sp. LB_tupeE]NWK79912.1 hypothetical protein [Aquitalea sp. LB_tupeE]
MLLLALPALNVLAASADMAMAGKVILSADCMAHASHASCHDKAAGKLSSAVVHAKAVHGMWCSAAGCVQLCAPALSQLASWSAAPLAQRGIFVPTLPATLTGITLAPPHRPPVLA